MGEYIRKSDVINMVSEMIEDEWGYDGIKDDVESIVSKISAADVAPVVHGRWVSCFEDWRKQIEGDKCSECGFEHYGTNIRNYNYCPNCGAKMDLEEER